MKIPKTTTILKANGDRVEFSQKKVASSLRRSGADEEIIHEILKKISEELYLGISTREIYKSGKSYCGNPAFKKCLSDTTNFIL